MKKLQLGFELRLRGAEAAQAANVFSQFPLYRMRLLYFGTPLSRSILWSTFLLADFVLLDLGSTVVVSAIKVLRMEAGSSELGEDRNAGK